MCFITSVYEESYRSGGRTTDVSTEELLERADMKLMSSKEVKQHRCRMIGHILRQDQNSDYNIAMTWAPEENKKRKIKNHLEANG